MRQSKRLNQFATTVRLRHSSRLTSPANNRLLSNKPRNSRQHSNRRRRLAVSKRHNSSKLIRFANNRQFNSRQHSSRPKRFAANRPHNSKRPSGKRRNSRRKKLGNSRLLSSGLTARQVRSLFHNRRCNRPIGPQRRLRR